jgi:hypothetical protein
MNRGYDHNKIFADRKDKYKKGIEYGTIF